MNKGTELLSILAPLVMMLVICMVIRQGSNIFKFNSFTAFKLTPEDTDCVPVGQPMICEYEAKDKKGNSRVVKIDCDYIESPGVAKFNPVTIAPNIGNMQPCKFKRKDWRDILGGELKKRVKKKLENDFGIVSLHPKGYVKGTPSNRHMLYVGTPLNLKQ
tara:strand:+ start:4601 stop:5080 length:480 start_codon:yes stop_codon:yes gene_type:complete